MKAGAGIFETRDQRSLALEIARKSMVLLKNDGVLPLNPRSGTIVVIGPNADDAACLIGGYSYSSMLELMTGSYQAGWPPAETYDRARIAAHAIQVPTVLSALKKTAPEVAFTYTLGCDRLSDDQSGISQAVRLAQQADAVVLSWAIFPA